MRRRGLTVKLQGRAQHGRRVSRHGPSETEVTQRKGAREAQTDCWRPNSPDVRPLLGLRVLGVQQVAGHEVSLHLHSPAIYR
jgi:hypothetical protein